MKIKHAKKIDHKQKPKPERITDELSFLGLNPQGYYTFQYCKKFYFIKPGKKESFLKDYEALKKMYDFASDRNGNHGYMMKTWMLEMAEMSKED